MHHGIRKVGIGLERLSQSVSQKTGTSRAFLIALGIVVLWALLGPLFSFSDSWQLVINTGTTIVTFLMVFLIQNTQNRDSEAIQLKLDELVRAMKGARNALIEIEELDDEELEKVQAAYRKLAESARAEDPL